jgi:hypothetical protein
MDWLAKGGNAWEMVQSYWQTRSRLMDQGEMFEGPPSAYLSNIDTAMDAFSPGVDRDSVDIDEDQLRAELQAAIVELRTLGYLTGE